MSAKTTVPAPGAGAVPIGSLSVLPARRQDIELHTADGLTLVGELALPADRPPAATLLTLHPLPTHGGYMDSHVLRKAAWRLPALAGLGVLRFNTRGTSSPRGTSGGVFDGGDSERYDVTAAIGYARSHELPNPWLVGWSFGTDLALRYGATEPVCGAILLSPTLRTATDADLDRWAGFGRPVIALVPEFDDFLSPYDAQRRFARIPGAKVITVEGARHLWVGEPNVRRVLAEIVHYTAPDVPLPLPQHWSGPMTTAESDTANTDQLSYDTYLHHPPTPPTTEEPRW